MRILCICPIGLGNYIMMYPAAAALKRHEPDASLHLLALRHSVAEAAESDPLWCGIHELSASRSPQSLLRTVTLLRSLHRHSFTASASFFPSNRWEYNVLPLFAGIKRRAGFRYKVKHGGKLSDLNTDTIAAVGGIHDVTQNLRLAGYLTGRDLTAQTPVWPRLFRDEDAERARAFLEHAAGGKAYFGLHPGSSRERGMAYKRWPAKRFAVVADWLCSRTGAVPLIFGGPEEAPLKRKVRAAMCHDAVVVSAAGVALTAAMIARCRLFLSNDSGLMHVAACQNVATVGLFGPTDERRTAPFGHQCVAVRKPMEGFPLWGVEEAGRRRIPPGLRPMQALDALTTGEVCRRVEPLLKIFRAPGGTGTSMPGEFTPLSET